MKDEGHVNKRTLYSDIWGQPHHVSDHRPRMTNYNRAAQFAPFAALSGFGDEVAETRRLTQRRMELDESVQESLDYQLSELMSHPSEHPLVTIEFFVPDGRKEGGSYQKLSGKIKKLDPISRLIYMESGDVISAREIIGISCFYTEKRVE